MSHLSLPPPFWKTLLVGFLAVLLTACLPIPIFDVKPSPAVAGTELTFDASSSVVSKMPTGNAAVSWQWKFGDGETAKGKEVKHTYAKAGTYSVELTVTDGAGRVGSTKDSLEVK